MSSEEGRRRLVRGGAWRPIQSISRVSWTNCPVVCDRLTWAGIRVVRLEGVK